MFKLIHSFSFGADRDKLPTQMASVHGKTCILEQYCFKSITTGYFMKLVTNLLRVCELKSRKRLVTLNKLQCKILLYKYKLYTFVYLFGH